MVRFCWGRRLLKHANRETTIERTVSRDFLSQISFFKYLCNSSSPLVHMLQHFRARFRFRRDIYINIKQCSLHSGIDTRSQACSHWQGRVNYCFLIKALVTTNFPPLFHDSNTFGSLIFMSKNIFYIEVEDFEDTLGQLMNIRWVKLRGIKLQLVLCFLILCFWRNN